MQQIFKVVILCGTVVLYGIAILDGTSNRMVPL